MQNYIQKLKTLEPLYKPNQVVDATLQNKYLVIFVGPAKVGKSSLMNEIVMQNNQFARVSGFTTRTPRPDDEPNIYRYFANPSESFEQIFAKAKAGELVQYALHPTTNNVYGTELVDYHGLYNCKDVLGHAVASFRALPCATSFTFSIVCDPDQWLKRLRSSYDDESDADLQKRIAEAKINLSWSLQDKNTTWVDNSDGQLHAASKLIQGYCKNEIFPDKNVQKQLKNKAQKMLSYSTGC